MTESRPNTIALSLVIPLYNRPDEIDELLESLTHQSYSEFEVVVVEDGSTLPSIDIVKNYAEQLNINYLVKENGGPGPARNFGADHVSGNYLVFLDSDCLIPERYIEVVLQQLSEKYTDAYGGPDRAHPSFTAVQMSINYSMTSFLTTGGIRGSKKSLEKFHPRSFNMGISKAVFQDLKGFSRMRFGEDVDFSMRIMEAGHTTQLIEAAFVYHKRRTDLNKFFKQVYNSGIARINLSKRHPDTLRLLHALPSIFVVANAILLVLSIFLHPIFIFPLILYLLTVFIDAVFKEGSVVVGILSIFAVITQLTGYGSGFLIAFWRRYVLKKDEFQAFRDSFYK